MNPKNNLSNIREFELFIFGPDEAKKMKTFEREEHFLQKSELTDSKDQYSTDTEGQIVLNQIEIDFDKGVADFI